MSLNVAYALYLFLAVINLSFAAYEFSYSDGNEFFLGFPTPKKTQGAINIDTSKVHELILPPLILVRIKYALTKLENTGELVRARLVQPASSAAAFGGPLSNASYDFFEYTYYWTNNPNAAAYDSLDGENFPFVAAAVFKNKKYPTQSEARKHRDGFVEVLKSFTICSTPNLQYNQLGDKVKEIRQPGSSTFVFLGTLIDAVDFIPVNSVYYAYPGSYHDPVTKKTYYCVTTILPAPNNKRCFTREQFNSTFGSLTNSQGGRLSNQRKQQPYTTPVVKGKYVIQPELLFQGSS